MDVTMKSPESISFLHLQEVQEDQSLDFHPKSFDDYLGQKELKQKLHVYTTAALMRKEPLDHLLLFGPPGLGKTTLAQIMAHIMGVGIKICSGPMLERTGDLVALLSGLEPRDILFIDEIHRMPTPVEEVLYSAMEHFKVDVIIGQGAGAQSINLPLSPFTLVGATTKTGMLSAPLRSRFGISERLEFYEDTDLKDIVLQNARYLKVSLSNDAALLIGQAARGTPRIAKKLLRRVRDFAQVNYNGQASDDIVREALSFLGIDSEGLNRLDYTLLKTIIECFNGGPVGLETLASVLGEDAHTLEDVYEPFLLRRGYLEKTSRGRQIPYKTLPYLKSKFFGQQLLS
ncbi:Holliday junction branch migration DNA helicase RuvB [Candidatus Dependentiae bacterium]|nr:Holliday junction branch migration DNA helicase RuvB [Candidatus Dependentiae bacterium]